MGEFSRYSCNELFDGASQALSFGTSGLRGLASHLSGPPAYAWTRGFLQMLRERGEACEGDKLLLARDLRDSSLHIQSICAAAVVAAGMRPVDCGAIPTPALAFAAIKERVPAIMVTGSHISADRNGLKFYRAAGEIDKADEAAIEALKPQFDLDVFSSENLAQERDDSVLSLYRARYLDFFLPACLSGLSIGVWQHSSVGRDVIAELLAALGARVSVLGRSDRFRAVDTEAFDPEDRLQLTRWSRELGLDAIVSADGDADRPLLFDRSGALVEGDMVGAITARSLGAGVVVTPLTSNSALERCGAFDVVRRCRVGSPFVIEEMARVASSGRIVVGFEANGGVLLGSDIIRGRRVLKALPTRDSVLPLLCCLEALAQKKLTPAHGAPDFLFNAKATDRLQDVHARSGARFLQGLPGEGKWRLASGDEICVEATDNRDGVRMMLAGGNVIHFRQSGNAPELRCYVEAGTQSAAKKMLVAALAHACAFLSKGGPA